MTAAVRRDRGALALLLFAVAGTGISVYLTTLHYAALPPVCTTGGIVDCAGVLRSSWSNLPGTGIPVTVPGLLWFVASGAMALLSLRAAATGAAEPRGLRGLHALWCVAGMAGVLYLVWAELVELGRICEWCTAVHLLVLASLLVSLVRLQPGVEAGADIDGDPTT